MNLSFDAAEATGHDATLRTTRHVLGIESTRRTDMDRTTVITATLTDGGRWTVISTAEGDDLLIKPSGAHVELSTLPMSDGLVQLAGEIIQAAL